MSRISTSGSILVLGLLGACTKSAPSADAGAEDARAAVAEDAEIAQLPDREDPAPALRGPWAVVLVAANDVLNVRAAPDADSAVVHTLAPTARDVQGTGQSRTIGRAIWREVEVGNKTGWVNSAYLTESVPTERLSQDPRVPRLLDALRDSVRAGEDLAPLISTRGLYLSVYTSPKWLPPARARTLWMDTQPRTFDGPACEACIQSTYRKVVGEGFLDAYEDADRELSFNRWKAGGNASARLPTKLSGFPFVTVYDPGDVADVPDWRGVTVFFEYLEGRPTVVGLVFDAWSP